MSALYWRLYYWLWPPRAVTITVLREDFVTVIERYALSPGMEWQATVHPGALEVPTWAKTTRLHRLADFTTLIIRIHT